ncbi:hypothetical protein Tco_1143931 [Tanacetum coccineum]
MSLELADRSIQYLRGITKNVLIKVDKFILLIDFIILDMPEDSRVPIILVRPFLATARAMIDRPPTKDDECYGIDDLDDTINAEAQELLANEEPDSILSRGLEKSIDQSDLEVCELVEYKTNSDSDSDEPIQRIMVFNERGFFLLVVFIVEGHYGGSKANSVLSGLTTKFRNIDGKIIGKDSTQRKAIRPNVASNMAVVNTATEVPVKDLQHDVNSRPDSSNLKVSPPMEGLHSDVNINMGNVNNLANSPKHVMDINVALVLVSEVIRGSTGPGDYSANNAVKQCNLSASDVPKSTVVVTDGASKTAPMSFAKIIKSQHVKKGNFRSLLNAEKVESFDFMLPKYAVDEVKSSGKNYRSYKFATSHRCGTISHSVHGLLLLQLVRSASDGALPVSTMTMMFGSNSQNETPRREISTKRMYLLPSTSQPIFSEKEVLAVFADEEAGKAIEESDGVAEMDDGIVNREKN